MTFDIDANTDRLDCTYTNRKRISSISTAQSFLPNDTATLTGTGGTPTGDVTFELFGPDLTPNDPTDNCAGTAKYTETVTLDANGSASTTNGTDTVGPTYTINKGNEGAYSWKVSYSGDSNHPNVSSCVEESTVQIRNGGTVSS